MSTEFEASKLGTKDHWDTVYAKELAVFEECGDEGEIWFGEESIDKMVQWAAEHVPSSDNPIILEIGSGNGTLLFSLIEEENYSPKLLCGIDYSEDAVNLAKNIANKRGVQDITFNTCDFLTQDPPPISEEQESSGRIDTWDLLLDKGTYDAIALGEKDELGRSPIFSYPLRTARLIKPGGFFLITSCNFTEQELRSNFATQESGLVYHASIKYPTFTFGGQSGAKYSSVAFRKQKSI
ncbi:S-adenosyl-L-methionine-dependent methyltransferase [Gymnopus androsaceus JB14]|uniref:Protein-lysine N-methyltransferase EFM4 n=1 Tax=Gymnopus androsaceus JB14 TaxID=1447944 RepID=A0A6A4H1Y1_9AGAR|nr:S-adenosyl-L-methionine-dependent methyltransferase [Gymnopus androsaceus JB14]